VAATELLPWPPLIKKFHGRHPSRSSVAATHQILGLGDIKALYPTLGFPSAGTPSSLSSVFHPQARCLLTTSHLHYLHETSDRARASESKLSARKIKSEHCIWIYLERAKASYIMSKYMFHVRDGKQNQPQCVKDKKQTLREFEKLGRILYRVGTKETKTRYGSL